MFKIRIPRDSTSCGTFGRYHRRKFKKNTDKDTKTVTHKRICFGIYSFSFIYLFLPRKKRSSFRSVSGAGRLFFPFTLLLSFHAKSLPVRGLEFMFLFVLFRLYKNLPEVKAKNEEKKRLAFYRTNRLRAQLYDKVGSRLFYYGVRLFSYIRHPSLRRKSKKSEDCSSDSKVLDGVCEIRIIISHTTSFRLFCRKERDFLKTL